MKLSARDLTRFIAAPQQGRTAFLIYGGDAMRVALKRQDLIAALVGPEAEGEMRLTRFSGNDLRADPAKLMDEMTAKGFFPGPRAVFVEDLTETHADPVVRALSAWQPGDATLVLTAGALKKTSKILKAVEGATNAYATAIYDDPMDRAEIETALRDAGLRDIGREAMADLEGFARALDPGDFRQVIEKLSLYKYGDATFVTPADVAAVAPATTEAVMDDLIAAVADGQRDQIGPLMVRLKGQGVGAVALSIAATRYFRQLYAASADPNGPQSGIAALRPPVFWKNRDRMIRQAKNWQADRLATALSVLTETDLTLRSAAPVPEFASMERTLIRLAMLGQSRR